MDERLSLVQLDLLKEVGTIGGGRAATALADLLGEEVSISVPQVSIIPLENISSIFTNIEKTFFVTDLDIKGDLLGRIFLMFSPEHAKFLAGNLMHKDKDEIDPEDEMFQSSLKEITNILSGSYISALAELTNLNMICGVPSLAVDMVGAILDFIFIQIAQYSDNVLYIKTDLKVRELNIEGVFLFFPHSESLRKIFEVFGIKETSL
ncbi:MAG: chemotaxis protein CheC [Candidatus Omnitrophica bacterium]|nr:chemotaxis protein CheC [Candidatus Omnitrophota bacterium]